MKIPIGLLFAITLSCALAGAQPIDESTGALFHSVRFELGDAEFAPGDNITIQQMHGTSGTIEVGGTYSVDGTYTLSSRDEAELAVFTTTISYSGATAVYSNQVVRIKRGAGSFHLVAPIDHDGYLHVSFYPPQSGEVFGGVYFGQGNRVLRSKSAASPVSLAGPNQALLDYLGNPVEPPTNMDARYTKEGLRNVIQLAARKAGINVKRIAIEDSEYPYMVGVICGDSDFAKLKAQIKKIGG
jgi:hypothetical protein